MILFKLHGDAPISNTVYLTRQYLSKMQEIFFLFFFFKSEL